MPKVKGQHSAKLTSHEFRHNIVKVAVDPQGDSY